MKNPWINSGLLSYAKALTGTYPEGSFGYVWGAQGQIITEEELIRLESIFGSQGSGTPNYYRTRARKWIGKKAADCSGLIMYIFFLMGIYRQDMTADTIMRLCEPMNESKPGDLVFRLKGSRAVHVGIRIQGDQTVHCRGTDYGLVTTRDWQYKWDAAGRFPGIPDVKLMDAIKVVRADMHI